MVEGLIRDGSLLLAIGVSLLAGLISFASPCVLPLVPGYLGFLGGTTDGSAKKSRLLGGVLLFIAGFSLVFVLLTSLGGLLGGFYLTWGPLITRILGIVIIAMGLVFMGFFGFAQREWKMKAPARAGLIGAPLLGIALGIGWAPCMGPTLGAITALSWNVGDPARAALLGAAYSAGLGIPFVLLALGLGWASGAVGFLRRHIRTINIIGGSLLILLGILMVTGLWTTIMSQLGAVIQSVELPL